MLIYRILAAPLTAASLAPVTAAAENTIKIGFPMPLSGPASVYGVPITKGAEMAVQEINAKGGGLGRKLELLERDSKANADEAAPLAAGGIAKENKIVFVAPTSKTIQLTSKANLHPYIFRLASNTDIDGRTGASIIAKWTDVKKVATIAPDYAYGRDAVAAFVDFIKKARPDIEIDGRTGA